MNMVLFGIGAVGNRAIKVLEKDHNIVFISDNDSSKWQTMCEGYRIENPAKIKECDCDVVVTSMNYGIEIAKQLVQSGVAEDRIYFYRTNQTKNDLVYDIYPLKEEKLGITDLRLIDYDLMNRQELGTFKRKIMIFCLFYSTYAKQLIENMIKRYSDIEISILTGARDYLYEMAPNSLSHIYYFDTMNDLKTILVQLPMYDVMQLLWIEREWAYLWKIIRQHTRILNLNVGGSDFYRTSFEDRNYKRNIISCADCISAETETTISQFEAYYTDSIKSKLKLLPFGIEVLDEMKKEKGTDRYRLMDKYDILKDKIIVTCGYNANRAHQHIRMVEALERVSAEVKNQMFFLFLMTYPSAQEKYIEDVDNKLKEAKLNYKIFTEFMNFKEMAEMSVISDIMINVQRTDQLSSTMLEQMYAGNVVIAGEWLPYLSLHKMGLYFLDVDSVDGITDMLEHVVNNIAEYKNNCKGNPEIVWRHSSWDMLAPRWHELWECS